MLFPSLEGFSTVFVIHTVKGFNVVHEAEVDLHDPDKHDGVTAHLEPDILE